MGAWKGGELAFVCSPLPLYRTDFQWGIPPSLDYFPNQVHSPGVGSGCSQLLPENGAKLIETLPPLVPFLIPQSWREY